MSKVDVLPPVRKIGVPDTLIITYNDGRVMRVPFFDYRSADAYLTAKGGEIDSFEVVKYTGE